jgi:predicted Zn-dependent peptidase
VADAVKEALITLPRGEINYDLGTDVRMNAVEAQPRLFREELDVGQGKLCLGFRLGDCMEDPNLPAILVFNALYGGGVNSRLFRNVREKLSLCYYVDSACDRLKGLMLVSSGIDPGNFDRTREEILSQLDVLRQGAFDDAELESARNSVISTLRSVTESPVILENYYLFQTLCGLDYGPEEDAALCAEVTREDIAAIARSVELDAVYFLSGPEDGGESEEAADAEA